MEGLLIRIHRLRATANAAQGRRSPIVRDLCKSCLGGHPADITARHQHTAILTSHDY